MRAAASLRAKQLALARAKSMLLIDDGESEVGELDVLLDQRVCADDQRAVARCGRGPYPPAFGCTLAAHQELDGQAGEAILEVIAEAAQVLPRKDLGRRHDHRLQAGGVRHRDTSGRDRCLTRTDVAVQEAVHQSPLLHVLEGLPRGTALRAGQLKTEASLEGVDDLLPVRDWRRAFRGDARAPERDGRLQLEQ